MVKLFTSVIRNKFIKHPYMSNQDKRSKDNKKRRFDSASGNILRLINFDPQIQHTRSFSSKTRYFKEERPAYRKQILQASNNHLYRETSKSFQSKRARSCNGLLQSQLFGQFCKGDILSNEIEQLSPLLRQKISELRDISSNRRSALQNHNAKDTQMIHFSQCAMQLNCQSSSVLHSRNKQICPFMKSVKARNIMNRSAVGRSKSQADQLFDSIELNSNSKYALTKRIMLSGENISSNSKERKSRGHINYGTKAYIEQRKARMNKGRKAKGLECSEECKPWETNGEHVDDVPSIFYL